MTFARVEIEIDGQPREVECGYCFYPATKGMRDRIGAVLGAGAPMEPDEPAHIEIHSYKLDGLDIEGELTVGQMQRIEGEILAKEVE